MAEPQPIPASRMPTSTLDVGRYARIMAAAVLVPLLVLSACGGGGYDAQGKSTDELIATLKDASKGNPTDDYPDKGRMVTDSTTGVPFEIRGPRCNAARELGKRKTVSAVDVLIAALNDGRVDACVVAPLGDIGDARAVLPLLDAFGDGVEFEERPGEGFVMAQCEWDDPKLCLPGGDVSRALNAIGVAGLDQLIPLGDAATYLAQKEACTAKPHNVVACRDYATRSVVTGVLGYLEDPRLEPTFIEWLKTPDFPSRATEALAMTYRDDVDHLLPLLQSKETVDIARGIIGLGQAGTERALIDGLMKFGDEELAKVYLNCGNGQLEAAAHDWASANGYWVRSIPTYGGSAAEAWGALARTP